MPLSRKMTCNRQFGSLNRGFAKRLRARTWFAVPCASTVRRDDAAMLSSYTAATCTTCESRFNGVPEPETRRLYERLVEGRLKRVLVER